MNWIETTEQMPRPGLPVIAFVTNAYGNPKATRRIKAIYAPEKTLMQSDECDGGDYDEETGEIWCAPGWYECNEFEETNWTVDGDINEWQPLPDPPKRSEYGEDYMQVESDSTNEDESNCKSTALTKRSLGLWFYYATQNLDGYPEFPDVSENKDKSTNGDLPNS